MLRKLKEHDRLAELEAENEQLREQLAERDTAIKQLREHINGLLEKGNALFDASFRLETANNHLKRAGILAEHTSYEAVQNTFAAQSGTRDAQDETARHRETLSARKVKDRRKAKSGGAATASKAVQKQQLALAIYNEMGRPKKCRPVYEEWDRRRLAAGLTGWTYDSFERNLSKVIP